MPPPVAAAASPQSAITDLLAGGMSSPAAGADAARAQLETLVASMRDLVANVDQIATEHPAVAGEMQQIRQLCKQAMVKAAQQAPTQTASSLAVPGGGGGGGLS